MGFAPDLGVYVIHSVAYNTQVITLTDSGTVVGWHQTDHPTDAQKWIVGRTNDENGGGPWTSLQNVANKRYLGLDVKNKFITTEKPVGWSVLSVKDGHFRIHDYHYRTADIELSGSSNGAVLRFGDYQQLPIQHWDFRPVDQYHA